MFTITRLPWPFYKLKGLGYFRLHLSKVISMVFQKKRKIMLITPEMLFPLNWQDILPDLGSGWRGGKAGLIFIFVKPTQRQSDQLTGPEVRN